MFRWHKDAAVCYAYLADVHSDTDISPLKLDIWDEPLVDNYEFISIGGEGR